MTDIVDPKKRRRMMSNIKGRNTRPEMMVRRGLHKLGFRYRVHYSLLPGKPDIVLPKYKAIILINGCFWHGHNCHLFKWPKTRPDFWKKKIKSNKVRDEKNITRYESLGWKVLVIWECSLKGRSKLGSSEVISVTANWIQFDDASAEIVSR